MDLFHCITAPTLITGRSRSEEKDVVENSVKGRRPSLPGTTNHAAANEPLPPARRAGTLPSRAQHQHQQVNGWSKHYEKKKSVEPLERLKSRTLSPPPETLPRKFSRSTSVIPGGTSCNGRLPRHPELPPLNTDVDAPRLKDYLEKPRLVSTYGRRSNQSVDEAVEELIPGLAKLSSYYNQTFLNVCDTCQSLNHRNPVSVLNSNGTMQVNRGM